MLWIRPLKICGSGSVIIALLGIGAIAEVYLVLKQCWGFDLWEKLLRFVRVKDPTYAKNADPNSTYDKNADSDPTSDKNADPDPTF